MRCVVVFLHPNYSSYADKILKEEQDQCGNLGL